MQQMQRRTVIFGVCFILIVFVVLVSFGAHRNTMTGHTYPKEIGTITIDTETLIEVLQEQLEERFLLQPFHSDIDDDGVVHFQLKLTRENLKSLMQTYEVPLDFALPLLPNEVPVELDLRFNLATERISVSVLRFELAGIDLTDRLSGVINSTVNNGLDSIGFHP